MGCRIGIDIGAVSATLALVLTDQTADIRSDSLQLLPCASSDHQRIYLSRYMRTRGKPLAAACTLLGEVLPALGAQNVDSLCLTGSGAKLAADKLGAQLLNEFQAIAAGLSAIKANAPCVFEIGGESSKYLRLSENEDGTLSIVDYATNGDCAAGTGSFIDQQAGRLEYAIEDIGPIVLQAERAAQIAGRCSVFAKSDMIHAQQKGYSPPEVLRGLCNAVARNFRSAVVRSHKVTRPVNLIGGVACNEAVVRAIREVFDLSEDELCVPPAHMHIPAIGAAVSGTSAGSTTISVEMLSTIRDDTASGDLPTTAPLSMDNVILLRNEVNTFQSESAGVVQAYLGIDIGSVSTNVVAIDASGQVVEEIYTRTQGRPIEVVAEALSQIAEKWGDRLEVHGVGTTGSGRELIGQLVGADTVNDEITAHKTGATYVGKTLLGGKMPDTIFEIGGQDAKYISLQDGIVVDFTMNDACAAGTGSFLEERAEELDISIKGEFADLALSSPAPIRLGERCTVFMERDVNSYMQRGADKGALVAGLAYSVVQNYINRVVRGRTIGDTIFFQGGTAYNDAVAAAFAAVTGKQIIVPPHNGVIGAIGAALLAKEMMSGHHHKASGEEQTVHNESVDETVGQYVANSPLPTCRPQTKFRGYDISAVDYTLREFTCKGCSNACQIQEFCVEGEKTYWGDKCSDRFRKRAKSTRQATIENLVSIRETFLHDQSDMPHVPADAPLVGIPLTMFAIEQLPFWRTMLATMGFRTICSKPTNKMIIQDGIDAAVAEPCFPIIVAHGHIADLDRHDIDHIFVPNVLSLATPWMHTHSHVCPWHQTLPFVTRNAPMLEGCAHKFMTPTVRFRENNKIVVHELFQCFGKYGVKKATVHKALLAAQKTQATFNTKLLSAGADAIDTLAQSGAPGVVLLGRPYNIHDAGMNLSVAQKLREQYGVNCIPLDFMPVDEVDIRDVNDNMFWDLGRRIIAAAKIVKDHPNLHIIYITNFKCGPDSYIKHFIRTASEKPFLTLQFDGHSNDAGMMTRCEAYLDSKGILRHESQSEARQSTRETLIETDAR